MIRVSTIIGRKASKLRVFSLFVFCCWINAAIAGTDPVLVTKLQGRNPNNNNANEIVLNAEKETVDVVYYDPVHFNAIDNPSNDKYLNTIALLINEDDTKFINADFRVTITMDISWTDKNGNQQGPISKSLEVDYKIAEGTKYDARSYFYFDNARKVKIKITGINLHGANWNPTEMLTIENRMEVRRDYLFNTAGTAIGVQAVPGEVTTDNKIDELVVSWTEQSFIGITHYDVEWTWVDIDALDRYKVNNQFDATLLFRNNSSRVTVTGDNSAYKVPLIYDGSGYLFYRVRPLQYREDGDIKEGEWSAVGTNGITYYSYTNGHEPDLNWQVSTSYAEDGKRKTVISYFDGTLRSRQTVTKDNVNNNTVVAETFYDYQGRPAISILPAPTLDKVITYAKNFNRFTTTGYAKDVYDLVPVGQTICAVNTPPLDNNYGTAKYYSPNNPKVNEGFNKYIPDAEGYAYAETRYTPDATGRIAAQGGVGADYQIGQGKHSTTYYYGQADQRELNALFGTEVGDQSHYFKNMVRDANGQYSVSYVDMHGRTVATALAGTPPANVQALNSYQPQTLTRTLLNRTNNIVKDRSIEMSTTLLVAKPGPHRFEYNLTPQSAEIVACNPQGQTVCYDCYYNLEIRITGTCGEAPIVIRRQNFTFGQYDTLCSNAPPVFSIDTTCQLAEGEYNITKVLTLSQDAQNWYRDNLYARRNICKILQQFYDENYAVLMAANNCAMTCASCSTALGIYAQYRTRFLQSQGVNPATTVPYENEILASYNEAKANCDALCNDPEGKLSLLREQLLQDVTPHQGQYAKLDVDLDGDDIVGEAGVVVYPPDDVNHEYGEWELNTTRPYNIFNLTPPYPGYRAEPAPYFQYPFDEKDNTRYYKDVFGRRDESINQTGTDFPNPLNPLRDRSADQFSNEFIDEWAASLIYYHPEYCKLKTIENNPALVSSFNWDTKVEKTDSWAAALTAEPGGYIVNSNILNRDPFFTANPGYKSIMLGFVNSNFRNGYSMWQYAMMSVRCTNTNDPACAAGIDAFPTTSTYGQTLCAADMNNTWRIFRTIYMTIKDSLVNDYLDQQCPGINYTQLKTLGYQRRFGHYADYYANNISTAITAIMSGGSPDPHTDPGMLEQYTANCEGYIDMWKNKLLECDQLTSRPQAEQDAILNSITSQMKQVCIWGSDEDHVFGSATLKPGDPRNPNSFESIIAAVFSQYGISPSALCNKYVIDYPQPYSAQLPVSDEPVTNPKDDCVCERLGALKLEKQTDGYTGTLSQFIQYKHGVYISQGLLDTLDFGCNNQISCNSYDPPLEVPGILNCNTIFKTCISCGEYVSLKQQFQQEFAGFTVIYANPANDEELNRNKAFEQFMNRKTSFRKSWTDYLAFETACTNYNQTWSCTQLDSIIALFHQTYPNAGWGNNCEQLFVQFFNQQFGTFFTWADLVALYKQYCASQLVVCMPTLNCNGFNQVITDFYALYGSNIVTASNCQSLFVSFFNNRFGTNYTWASLQTLYSSMCGGDLDVCNNFSCVRLQAAMQAWFAQNSQPWLNSNCTSQWVSFFNNWFQSNLAEWQIAQLYTNCNLSYSPCTAQVQCTTLQQLVTMYNNAGTAACDSSGLNMNAPDYCNNCFAWFVNQNLNTNYTYEQIALMYQQVCGQLPGVCSNVYNCDSLSAVVTDFTSQYNGPASGCADAFVVYFNNHYNTSLTHQQIMAIYKLYCGTQPAICGRIPITTCAQLEALETDYIKSVEAVSLFGPECRASFTAFINQALGDTLSYQDIAIYFNSLCGRQPNVCDSSGCTTLSNFLGLYHQQFDTLQLPQALCRDLFTKKLNDYLGSIYGGSGSSTDGPGQSFSYTWPQIAAMYQQCGIVLNVCPQDGGGLPNCSKILSARTAFYQFYNINTLPDCNQVFTEFFNLYFHTSFANYTALNQWAGGLCNGLQLNVCSSGSTGEGGSTPLPGENNGGTPPPVMPPMLCDAGPVFPTLLEDPKDPCDYLKTMALHIATEQYNIYVTNQKNEFDKKYQEKCLGAAGLESFTVTAEVAEYHYTLYYYNQAGQLVKTVPPAGVRADFSAGFHNLVEVAKEQSAMGNWQTVVPPHVLATEYRYNTLGQVVQQRSPDGGLSKFWYDRLGRLVVSQNNKQWATGKYSYTKYDVLGRITEVGQLTGGTAMTQNTAQSEGLLANWLNDASNLQQITKTVYDVPKTELCIPAPSVLCQQNLRNRVSYTYVQPTANYNNNNLPYSTATYYTYDIHGNVDVLLQHYNAGIMSTVSGHAFKRMEYKYDLVSGKVNEVAYQPGLKDQYYHRYSYDAENKLTKTETSADHVYWQQQAAYSYYRHGPLARTEIGQLGVQGVDYVYTLQGWMKGVNSTAPSNSPAGGGQDPGGDGSSGARTARDAYGFSLNYNSTDYKAINNTVLPYAAGTFNLTNTEATTTAKPLYNGNIAAMAVSIPKLGDPHVYGYKYDQLNRIVSMDVFTGINSSNVFTANATANYKERVSYDANGNILTYLRNGSTTGNGQLAMDNLTYGYNITSGNLINNRLRHVKDAIGDANYTTDIDNQDDDNYAYDEIGNLIKDTKEGIGNNGIVWNVYGKIESVTKTTAGSTVNISYTYDASGNRISKTVGAKTTWYVRDASGNVMAVYENGNAAVNNSKLSQIEVHLYGSSRIGMWQRNLDVESTNWWLFETTAMPGTGGGRSATLTRGTTVYELSNHLGNVLVTVSDRKVQVSSGGVTVDYYTADVVSATDYYPFGMEAPGRSYQPEKYRYSINCQEKTPEIGSNGTTAEFWQYDARIGRRWNVDPVVRESESPYLCFIGNPVLLSDPHGNCSICGQEHAGGSCPYSGTNTMGSVGGAAGVGAGAALAVGGSGTEKKAGYDFSSAKVEKKEYKDYGDGLLNIVLNGDKISHNITANTINGVVNLAENATNLVASSEGRQRVLNEYGDAAANFGYGAYRLGKRVQQGEFLQIGRETLNFLATPEGFETVGSAVTGIALTRTVSLGTARLTGFLRTGNGGGNFFPIKGATEVEQYALRAAEDGFYPVMKRGFKKPQELTWLNKGEVWKFGTTKNPSTRYSQTYLKNTGEGLVYDTEFIGTLKQATTVEKMKILNFRGQNGFLPAGNKIVK